MKLNESILANLNERYFPGSEQQYFCRDCGLTFEADEITSEDDEGNDLCPACGSKNIVDTGKPEKEKLPKRIIKPESGKIKEYTMNFDKAVREYINFELSMDDMPDDIAKNLKALTPEDINAIASEVYEEVEDKLNEIINDFLYDYK